MELTKKFDIDPVKANNGVELPLDTAFFTVCYFNSSLIQIKVTTELKKLVAAGKTDVEATSLCTREILVNDVVKGFRNLQENGVELVYSKEELARLFDTYEGLDIAVMDLALQVDAFKREAKVATKGK